MSVIKWGDKRYWYFVTQRDMGKAMSLNPRTPEGMCDDEPNTKRICVAPTAAHCFSAIGIYSGSPVYVYRTRRQVKARIPYNVGDSSLTKEHWLMTRTRFTQVAVINIPEHGISWEYGDRAGGVNSMIAGMHFNRIQCDMRVDWEKQRYMMTRLRSPHQSVEPMIAFIRKPWEVKYD